MCKTQICLEELENELIVLLIPQFLFRIISQASFSRQDAWLVQKIERECNKKFKNSNKNTKMAKKLGEKCEKISLVKQLNIK